jgi:organic hydroperoxide reductase OsmC/OhrA
MSWRFAGPATAGRGPAVTRAYGRDHEVTAEDRAPIAGSSAPGFRGDPDRWNPEQLLVAALAQCHMLWFLHLAAVAGIVVCAYEDRAFGELTENRDGSGQFSRVVLRPVVTVADRSMRLRAELVHADAHGRCFIARSVNFPVGHEPTVHVADSGAPGSSPTESGSAASDQR